MYIFFYCCDSSFNGTFILGVEVVMVTRESLLRGTGVVIATKDAYCEETVIGL